MTPDSITIATGAAGVSLERTKVARVQVHGAVALDQTFGRYFRNEGIFTAIGAALSPYKTIYRAP